MAGRAAFLGDQRQHPRRVQAGGVRRREVLGDQDRGDLRHRNSRFRLTLKLLTQLARALESPAPTSWKVPGWGRGLMSVVVIPLVATLISGFVMLAVLGRPLAALMAALTELLNGMTGASAIVLGVILGLMMAFDMGGPLNKTAYGFATAGLGAVSATATDAPQLKIMAAVMLAGMAPPLALALATVVRPRLFDVVERENGKAAWALGASFITEGAIPFAAADPLRVIPSMMFGSAVTGAVSMGADVTLRAPHGGVFVFFAVGNIIGFLIALVAGVVVATASVVLLKTLTETRTKTGSQTDQPIHATA